MKSLSKTAKHVFCKIIAEMKDSEHLKLEAKRFLPLTVELLGSGIDTVLGKASNYSFCNYYELNGDLMQAPEMCFLVIDERSEDDLKNWDKVHILPYMFQYADICLTECSIHISANKVVKVNDKMQYRHTLLAEQWISEIKTIGYLNF